MNPFAFSPLSIFLFVSAGLCLWLGIHALRQQPTAFARYYAGLMFCAMLYALGYGLEIASPDLTHMNVMLRIQYFGIPFVPFFWVGLAWSYQDPRGIPAGWKWLLLVLSALIFLVFQTNDLHHLYYTRIDYFANGNLAVARIGKGVCYWLTIAYLNLSTAVGVILLFRAWRQAIPFYRRQALLLLAGSFLPWLFHLVYQVGLSPSQIDLGPFGLAATGLAYAVAALRHSVLNVLPLARDIVFDGITEGVIVLDARSRVIDFNRAATCFFPTLGLKTIGLDCASLSADPSFMAKLRKTDSSIHQAEGRQLEIRRHVLRDKRGTETGTALMIQDITDKLALIEELRQLATIDELTGCSNRRHLIELSEREVRLAARHRRPLSLVILDLDNFKAINDTRGHLAGDQMLRDVARTLRHRLRTTDILGRYGGDEFIIALPDTNGQNACRIAEQLRQSCHEECSAGLSLGIAELDPSRPDFTDLLRHADLALYRAKTDGRDRVVLFQGDS